MKSGSTTDPVVPRRWLNRTAMALLIIFVPLTVWTLGAIFLLGGVYVAIEETLEDSFCAELVDEEHTAWRLVRWPR